MEFQQIFKILKDDVIKVLYSICQQIWKTQQWPQDQKRSISSHFLRRAVLKNVQIIRQLHSSPMLVRFCSKSSKLGLSICKLRTSRFQVGFRKGRGTRDQIALICWIIKKAWEIPENIYLYFTDCIKPLTVCIIKICRKLLKRWDTRPCYLSPEKPVCGSRGNSQNPIWNN